MSMMTGTAMIFGPTTNGLAFGALTEGPGECPDCTHATLGHTSTLGCLYGEESENGVCLCSLSPDEIGEMYESNPEPTED